MNIPPPHNRRLSFEAVNTAAQSAIPDLLANWLPGGKRQAGEWVVRNTDACIGWRWRKADAERSQILGGAR